jgi:hypothetical protein
MEDEKFYAIFGAVFIVLGLLMMGASLLIDTVHIALSGIVLLLGLICLNTNSIIELEKRRK